MNILFRATNKSGNKLWIIAETEEEALDIAIDRDFVKVKTNCKLKTKDNKNNTFFDFFKNKGNDMTQVEENKGIGCVLYKDGMDKGTWLVNLKKNKIMSSIFRVMITPYIYIKSDLKVDVPKIKRACLNHPNLKVDNYKFCPKCGSEVIIQEYTEKEKIKLNFKLYEIQNDDFIYQPEYFSLNEYNIVIPQDENEYTLIVDSDDGRAIEEIPNNREEALEWFNEKAKPSIDYLKETFGEENIEVRYGILGFWV
jgi:hypothetical protein